MVIRTYNRRVETESHTILSGTSSNHRPLGGRQGEVPVPEEAMVEDTLHCNSQVAEEGSLVAVAEVGTLNLQYDHQNRFITQKKNKKIKKFPQLHMQKKPGGQLIRKKVNGKR